jgi:alkaline phosphatase D
MRFALVQRLAVCVGLALGVAEATAQDAPLSRIAFGSCAKQGKPQPIWQAIVAQKPELFLFIGDNIYGDTLDMSVMRAKYGQLGAEPGYQALKAACPILATWDDHDYGMNDAGAEYGMREASQREFAEFFGLAADSPVRQRPGVYDARVFGPPGKRVQVVLLDTRYFRSPLKVGEPGRPGDGRLGKYLPDDSPALTMLGDAQWTWLEEQLRQPAEVRIIVSSVQVVADEHRFEKWANLPRERERLFRLIVDTGAAGVLFISGDRHMAELSCLEANSAKNAGVGYPLYDLTSSALNQPGGWYNEINPRRIGRVYNEPNFGLITIDWTRPTPAIGLEIRKEDGEVAIWHEVALGALRR